jgi:hypothetical protein
MTPFQSHKARTLLVPTDTAVDCSKPMCEISELRQIKQAGDGSGNWRDHGRWGRGEIGEYEGTKICLNYQNSLRNTTALSITKNTHTKWRKLATRSDNKHINSRLRFIHTPSKAPATQYIAPSRLATSCPRSIVPPLLGRCYFVENKYVSTENKT